MLSAPLLANTNGQDQHTVSFSRAKNFGDVVAVQACSGSLLGARPDFNSLNASKPCHRNRVAIEMLNNVLFGRTDHSARKEVVDDAPSAAAHPARAAAKGRS